MRRVDDGHPADEVLSAHADGELSRPERKAVERHLEACERCRSFVVHSRALSAELRALPREIAPPRDLRPRPPGRAPGRTGDTPLTGSARRTGSPRWAGLAAAVVLVAALGSWLFFSTGWLTPGPDSAVTSAIGTGGAAPGLASRLRDYERASRELAALYERGREGLPDAAAGAVDASLARLEEAIARTAASAAEHPDAVQVRRMLEARYERKIELLRSAIDLWGEG